MSCLNFILSPAKCFCTVSKICHIYCPHHLLMIKTIPEKQSMWLLGMKGGWFSKDRCGLFSGQFMIFHEGLCGFQSKQWRLFSRSLETRDTDYAKCHKGWLKFSMDTVLSKYTLTLCLPLLLFLANLIYNYVELKGQCQFTYFK